MRELVFLACVGAAAAAGAAQPGTRAAPLQCTAVPKAKDHMNEDRLCSAIAQALTARLGRRVTVVAAGKSLPQGDAFVVTVSHPRPNALTAGLRGRVNGRSVASGPLTIDVMDRTMRPSDVDKLAELLATALKNG
ncbi:hypothetical protein ACFFF7_04125 [Novosphingobium aquiterrae]|uniref:Uncharacterized protein n=1 Tax=Novosphingobium aquiterrae TaxID=624388 RepID=A0ABV6PFH8_9SPHN